MKKVFLSIILGLVFAQTAPANDESTNFKITCHVQDYICLPNKCVWGTLMGHEKEFNLVKNPSYPNSNYPNQVWEGEFEGILNYTPIKSEYKITVKVIITPQNKKSYSVGIDYFWGDLIATGGGTTSVKVGLVDKKLFGSNEYPGRGFLCHSPELSESF